MQQQASKQASKQATSIKQHALRNWALDFDKKLTHLGVSLISTGIDYDSIHIKRYSLQHLYQLGLIKISFNILRCNSYHIGLLTI